ncbi:MAG: hypothetical protein IPF87_22965 [Gemmatimonadetes bacterium]|nr:hypothetical protein [Gemmatimonadota bacterium]
MANPIIKVVLSAVDEITGVTKKAGESVSSFSDKAKAALGSLAALGVGAALGAFFKSAIEEASAAEVGMGRLGTAVRNAGGNFDALKPQLESTVASVMRLSTATDDDLRAALTNMITISGDVAGSQRNLALAADLATFKHIGLEEAANVVGKAMNGNVTAFNKLGGGGRATRRPFWRTPARALADSPRRKRTPSADRSSGSRINGASCRKLSAVRFSPTERCREALLA